MQIFQILSAMCIGSYLKTLQHIFLNLNGEQPYPSKDQTQIESFISAEVKALQRFINLAKSMEEKTQMEKKYQC